MRSSRTDIETSWPVKRWCGTFAVLGAQERGVPLDPPFVEWAAAIGRSILNSADPKGESSGIDMIVALRHSPSFDVIANICCEPVRPESVRLAALTALPTLDAQKAVTVLSERLADVRESQLMREKSGGFARHHELAGISRSAADRADRRADQVRQHHRRGSRRPTRRRRNATSNDHRRESIAAFAARTLRAPNWMASLKSPEIVARIAKLTEGLPPADAAIAELLRRRAEGFAKSKPDAIAGAKVSATLCQLPSASGKGTKIGPHLDGIGVRGLERLLEDTLDPNRNVDQSFRTTSLAFEIRSGLAGLGAARRRFGGRLGRRPRQGTAHRKIADRIA